MTTWVGDLEGDNLAFDITNIWCIVNYDVDEERFHISVPGWWRERKELVGIIPKNTIMYPTNYHHLVKMMDVDKLVYHNGINFDRTAIRKLHPWWDCKLMEDTFVMSSLFNPDRPIPKGSKGAHSIDAYARRFGMYKPVHEDWSRFSPEMLHRCIEDVKIGVKTWDKLNEERDSWDWGKSLDLEYAVATYHAKQEMNGCPFDLPYALKILSKLDIEIKDLTDKLLSIIPKTCRDPYKRPLNKPFLAKGGYSSNLLKWYSRTEADKVGVFGSFSRIEFNEINLNSDQQVKNYLLTQGWTPTEWNYKKDKKTKRFMYENGKKVPTSPRLTEDSYGSISSGVGKDLARRAILLHRRRTIQNIKDPDNKGLISFIRRDGRIPAEAAPQATNTGRYRHKKIVNIPKAKKKIVYGIEMRSMFYKGTNPDEVMIGCDASGLEARMEAHYCYPFEGGKEYAHELLDGDVHKNNAVLFGLAESIEEVTDDIRDSAKPAKYGVTYGAQADKLAETLGCSKALGQVLFDNFWDGNTALKGFRDHCISKWKERGGKSGGYLVGLDGRKIRTRSEHSLVNCMFQSAGSIVVKTATCLLFNKWVPMYGLDARLVIHMHDEYNAIVNKKDQFRYAELAVDAFRVAGEFWKLNVPLTGEAKIGRNWAEVH